MKPALPLLVLAVVAAFSIAGTYDNLSFHRAIGHLDAVATAAGATPNEIDSGPGLVGYRSFDLMREKPAKNPRPTWWTVNLAPGMTSEWIIGSGPAPGYEVVAIESYPTILQTKPSALYLQRRT